MNSLLYKEYSDTVWELCKEAADLLEGIREPEIKQITAKLQTSLAEFHTETKLSIAFIGQYNAGKTSTIAALTGAKFVRKEYEQVEGEQKFVEVYEVGQEKLSVGAQIMTDQTKEYVWNNVRIIDTPGIYAGRPDHDARTLERISKSDLLIFVISNELFNPQGGKFFRRIIHEMNRVNQVLLVVNKMSREQGTPGILQKSMLEVMEPYHPDDFYTCYIDAHDYLEALSEEDEEERKYLIEESNFEAFTNTLQLLIEKNALTARLVTPLHICADVLDGAYNMLTIEDNLQRDMLEILRRKGLLIRSAMNRFKNVMTSELNKLEHNVVMIGESVAGKADGNHSSEEINSAIKKAERNIELESEKTLNNIQAHLTQHVEQLNEELANLKNSSLGRSIANLLENSHNKKTLGEREFTDQKSGFSILEKGPSALNKVGQFATNVSKEAVYNFVKFFGGKFKPWGATKLTKFINKLGPVLSIIGTVLEIFLTAKEEYDVSQQEQMLREARAELRKDFRNIASEIRKEYEESLNNNILPLFKNEITDIEKDQNELRQTELLKDTVVNKIGQLLLQTKQMITKLQEH